MPTDALFHGWLLVGGLLGVVLFRWLSPATAVVVVLLGGFLLLPPNATGSSLGGVFAWDKRVVSSLAILAGSLLFHRRAIARWPFAWLDLPMGLFLLWPLFSWLAHGGANPETAAAQLWRQAMWWGVPYWAGRTLLRSPADAPRILLLTLAAGVAYAPLAWLESLIGLERFFTYQLFGFEPPINAERLGGIRPRVFLSGGLELCLFYALVTTCGLWLVRHPDACGVSRRRSVPLTALATISLVGFRGVGGYLAAAYAIPALLTRRPRPSVVILATMMLLPALYVTARGTNLLAEPQARKIGEPLGDRITGSFGARVRQETEALTSVREHAPWVGLGPTQYYYWADGRWVMVTKEFGFAGLAVWWLAMFAIPATACLTRIWQSDPKQPADWLPQAGLLVLVAVYQADCLINHPLTPLVAFLPAVLVRRDG